MTPNWGDQLTRWRAGLPSRGNWAGWRNRPCAVQPGETPSPAPGKTEPEAAVQAGHCLLGQQLCRKVPGALGIVSCTGATLGLAAVRSSSIQHCRSRSTARKWRDMMIPLNSSHLRPHLDTVSSGLGSPVLERHCQTGARPVKAHQDAQGLEHLPCEGSLRDGAASVWRREGFGGTSEQPSPTCTLGRRSQALGSLTVARETVGMH